jgi:hypothetical protein
MALKLTLASGDEHVVKFDKSSTLTVANQVQAQPGEVYTDSQSWSDITGVEIVDDPSPVEAAGHPEPLPQETTAGAVDAIPAPDATTAVPADDPSLETPQAAIDHASTLPLADAQTHIDAALVKFPDDPDLVAAKADLDAEAASS